jgi:hypothetical protein
MSKLTIQLPEETAAQLNRLAERLGTPVESLATEWKPYYSSMVGRLPVASMSKRV